MDKSAMKKLMFLVHLFECILCGLFLEFLQSSGAYAKSNEAF